MLNTEPFQGKCSPSLCNETTPRTVTQEMSRNTPYPVLSAFSRNHYLLLLTCYLRKAMLFQHYLSVCLSYSLYLLFCVLSSPLVQFSWNIYPDYTLKEKRHNLKLWFRPDKLGSDGRGGDLPYLWTWNGAGRKWGRKGGVGREWGSRLQLGYKVNKL